MPRANTSSPEPEISEPPHKQARRNSSSPSASPSSNQAPAPSPSKSRSSGSKILEGCLAINKPRGISSAQVIRNLQKHFNPSALFAPSLAAQRNKREKESRFQQNRRSRAKRGTPQVKMGHGGTLDPLATGVLIIGVGSGTKELSRFLECTKTYECVVLFGAATDTYDCEGNIVGRRAYEHITKGLVEEKLEGFRGRGMQRPPIYSALSVQGKRLYEYAREGVEVPVEIKERAVEVTGLEMVEWLEGGAHGYVWPKVEAPMEEKKVASKLTDIGSPTDAAITNDKDINEQTGTGVKRKRGSEDIDGHAAVSETSESKAAQERGDQPEMSGALDSKTKDVDSEESRNVNSATSDQPPPKPPAARIRMTVTSGFYVRSFCHDLGAAVGSLAIMSELIRSRQADFSLEKGVLEFADLDQGEDQWAPKVEAMLEDWNAKKPSR